MRVMEAADLCLLRFVTDLALSPDGTRVAFTVLRPDCVANRNRTSIWVAPVAGGPACQVTGDDVNASSPSWSPDGTRFAYAAAGRDVSQIFVLDHAGGEIRQLTQDAAHPATVPHWSPDGTAIAYLCKVPSLSAPESVVTYPDAADRPRVIAWSTYKREGEGYLDQTRDQLFVVPAAGGEPHQLTSFPMGVGGPTSASERRLGIGVPAWSPDATRIAFVAYEDRPDGLCDVWTVAVADGTLTRVTPNDGGYASPAWSPDGRSLAVIGMRYPRIGGANNYLWVVSASGGPLRRVMDFDGSPGSGIMSDTGAGDRSQPAWVGDDLYFLMTDRGAAQIWRVSASGDKPEPVTTGAHAIARWDIDRNGATLVYAASGPTNPGEVYFQRLDETGAAARLTGLNRDVLAEIEMNAPEEFWLPVEANGEAAVQGWMLKPPGFDPAKKYPLLLEIHGGPAVSYGMSWFHEFQFLAACGYVLVYCNPRGSQGYGDRFATTIYQGWGPKPFEDVMHAVDYAATQASVDPDRLYVTGGSYGGYLTNWVVTHTDRFRAAATQRCVSDLRSLALAGDCNTIWMMDYYGGMPWDEPAVYAEDSPITHIARCTTPLFIEHEEEDHRDPMDQAEQIYNALRRLGIDTELVRYPNESHGMSRNGKPLHRIDRLLRIRDWFARYA